jgi:hypothetical protein
MVYKRLNIIARYNENLDWVKDLKGDVIVYNKGENYIWDYTKIDVKNYGRESETYVRAVLDFYNHLDDYDDFVFLQGNPFEHTDDLFERLNYVNDEFIPLCSSYATHILPSDNYIFNTHKYLVDVLCKENAPETKIVSDFSFMMDHGNNVVLDKNYEIKQLMYVMQIMRIPYKSLRLDWTCGAMYTVNTKLLKRKSKSWWENFHELIRYWFVDLNNEDLGYILERMWPIIWTHHDNYGGWKI